ncbi:MAG: hypothetical protein AAFR38_12200 [Planctomycetota bacterium]
MTEDDRMLLERARRALEAERAEAEREAQGKRLARRLIIAFGLIIALGVVFFVVLPEMGLRLPPIIPIACFATIAIGSILAHREDYLSYEDPPPDEPIDGAAHDVIAKLPGAGDDDR